MTCPARARARRSAAGLSRFAVLPVRPHVERSALFPPDRPGSACRHAQHPWVPPGAGFIDAWQLQFTADTRITTDPHCQLPAGTEPVAGTAYDFSRARPLSDLKVGFASAGLAGDPDGRAWVRLTGPDRTTAACGSTRATRSSSCTPPRPPRAAAAPSGLSTEPMICPPPW